MHGVGVEPTKLTHWCLKPTPLTTREPMLPIYSINKTLNHFIKNIFIFKTPIQTELCLYISSH